MPSLPEKTRLVLLFLLTGTLSVPGFSRAETHTVPWDAVTTYIDGTPIERAKTVRHDIFFLSTAGNRQPGTVHDPDPTPGR